MRFWCETTGDYHTCKVPFDELTVELEFIERQMLERLSRKDRRTCFDEAMLKRLTRVRLN